MTDAQRPREDRQKPRLLLITRNFPPIVGGMERLLYHIFEELVVDYDVALVGPRGCERQIDGRHEVLSVPLTPLWRFFPSALLAAFRLACLSRPRLVFAGSGVMAPLAVITGRMCKASVICYLHGLDLVARNFIYQQCFIRAIRRCDLLIVNSHKTASLALEKGISQSKIQVLHPGVDIPGAPNGRDRKAGRVRLGLDKEAKVLLSVGRLTRRKGLMEFLDNVFPQLVKEDPTIHLLIIGDEPTQALKQDGNIRQQIEELILARGLGKHITLLGRVEDEVLRDAYFSADMLIFPAREVPGDVEGFGMVACEAAAHGLPTVAFAVGGIPDAVQDGVSGYLIPPGDNAAFGGTIQRHVNQADALVWSKRCRTHAAKFVWHHFGARLRQIIAETIAKR